MAILSAAARLVAGVAAVQWAELSNITDPFALTSFSIGVSYDSSKHASLEETFWAVSDPSNPRFSQHLTKEQVDALLTPPQSSIDAVTQWLSSEPGVLSLEINRGDYIQGIVTLAGWSRLLGGVTFSAYDVPALRNTSEETGIRYRLSSTSSPVSLPPHISSIVDFVYPTTYLPSPRRANLPLVNARKVTEEEAAASGVTPSVIRAQYGIGSTVSKTASNKQLAAGFLGQYASSTDLDKFNAQFWPQGRGTKLNYVGPNDQTHPGVEASLDVQYITAIGAAVNTTFWYTTGCEDPPTCDNEPYVEWLAELAQVPDAQMPNVISVSYGDNENDVPDAYKTRANTGFIALGTRGISVMFSSGDGGVAGSQTSPCTTFIPTFPAGSIYVTAVGGTTGNPEVAASFSSGGFSNFFGRPSYQTAAVQAYLSSASNLPPSTDYNQTGAGIPDVAALSENFNIVCGGSTFQVDGTSCAAPTFSGLVSLLNDARMQAGKKALGYLNQIFYANPDVFTDITSGNNPGCNTDGFYAAKGWDPITGLGSPNFAKLLTLVLSLP